jgi:putative hydrolase of the HAD superfamily
VRAPLTPSSQQVPVLDNFKVMNAFDGVRVVGIDGDDTLWHNEERFKVAQQQLAEIVGRHAEVPDLGERLLAVERRNLGLFGYGVKGFTLSMIETAVEVTRGQVAGGEVQELVEVGRRMLESPVVLLDGVDEAVDRLASAGLRLVLLTKGDLFDQETRIARAGIAHRFWQVEVVSEKDVATYRRVLERLDVDPGEFLMVGNSLRSDVLPALAIGAAAVWVPYHLTWSLEHAERPAGGQRFREISSLRELPDLLA